MESIEELHSKTVTRWKQLHFAERRALNDPQQHPFARADIMRSQLAQIEFARASLLYV